MILYVNVICYYMGKRRPGGFHSYGGTLYCWMVDFMENPNLKCFFKRGYPHFRKPLSKYDNYDSMIY